MPERSKGKYSRDEVEYIADEGFVRLNLRRPVNLYVPTDRQETYNPKAKVRKPNSELQLEWVYGYRGRDCRNNLCQLSSGEFVYFSASVVIIYNDETKTQRHFLHHKDDIKCIAVHPDGKTVATGQVKGREDLLPHVCIWDSETLEILNTIGMGTFNRGVSAVGFSKDGDTLACVDDAPEPRLSLWKWAEEEKLTENKAAADPIIGVTFTSEEPSRVVTSGKNHMAFWLLNDEGAMTKKSAIFGSYEKPKYVTTVSCLANGDVISGDSNGNILVWKQGGNTVTSSKIGAHDGAVFFLSVDEDGNILTAGKDRKIQFYDAELSAIGDTTEIPDDYGSPRVVLKHDKGFIIGTTNNAIIKTAADGETRAISQGHLEELWGLATHHTGPYIITAGQDGRVFYRDSSSHDTIWMKNVEFECQSADFCPGADVAVVAGAGGKWVVINLEDQEIVFEGSDGDEIIQVVRFSPDGNLLALGSRDNRIYIYVREVDDKEFTKAGVLEGHSSFITHFDWAADGSMIRSNSGDYEVLFWKLEDFSLETQNENFRDVEWATANCILAYQTIGIWPPGTDGTHINSCNKAKQKPLMATGDDYGLVKLFSYPAPTHDARHWHYHAHSSHITNVSFFRDDCYLVTAGGRDNTVMQWKVSDIEE